MAYTKLFLEQSVESKVPQLKELCICLLNHLYANSDYWNLREEFPAVAFKCSTQEQRSNLGWKSSKSSKGSKQSKSSKASKLSNHLHTSDCLGAETLIKLLKNYSRSHELKKSIIVGIIGLPNVGKSSLINSLKRAHVVNVGATPGLTRSLQEVHLDKNVKLLE